VTKGREGLAIITSDSGESTANFSGIEFGTTSFGDD
jgi:hypothetical protein